MLKVPLLNSFMLGALALYSIINPGVQALGPQPSSTPCVPHVECAPVLVGPSGVHYYNTEIWFTWEGVHCKYDDQFLCVYWHVRSIFLFSFAWHRVLTSDSPTDVSVIGHKLAIPQEFQCPSGRAVPSTLQYCLQRASEAQGTAHAP